MLEFCNDKYTLYPVFSLISLILFSFVYFKTFKITKLTNFLALIVIFGGIMNLVEWVRYGCVKDYIKLFNISFYNLNDLLIMIGLSGLLFILIYDKRN